MNNKSRKSSGIKARTVIVRVHKPRPKITYPQVTVPEQKPELAQVVVRMTKENTNANPKNKGTQVKGRSSKS